VATGFLDPLLEECVFVAFGVEGPQEHHSCHNQGTIGGEPQGVKVRAVSNPPPDWVEPERAERAFRDQILYLR
jgi:hypothetical protein